jgi:integrase
MYDRINPIAAVRQGSKREKIPDILTLDEMVAIVSGLESPAHKLMVCIAAVTALRRSEIRGLKWKDVDTEGLWLQVRRGKVRQHQTKLKTEASRKGVTLSKDLADAFLDWRSQCLYRADDDWVFASPLKDGRQPLWLDQILKNYVRRAARAVGIDKKIGWHTFRRSVSSLLGDAGEPLKVVSELLRHANIRITAELYQQAGADAKRAAQERMKKLFAA